MSEEKKVALVTGGGTGIGAACCRALAAEGFAVGIHYRSSKDSAEALAGELEGSFLVQADITSVEEIDRLIGEIKSGPGRLDVLVNNAGFNVNAPVLMMKVEDYDTVTAVARGTWYLTKMAVRRFMFRKGGRIVNISSVVGSIGNAGQVPYTMVKAGLDVMSKSLAAEFGDRGVLVNSVAPGFIETDMTGDLPEEVRSSFLSKIPLGRMGAAEEVADVVAFLATRGSYIQGTVLHVNGGLFGG